MDDFVPLGYLAFGKAIIRVAELTQDGYADACLSEEQAGMLQAYRERLRPERPSPAVPVPTVGYGGRSPAAFKAYEDRAPSESNEDEPPPSSFNLEELKALLEKEPELKERRQAAHRAAGKLLRARLDAGTIPSAIITNRGPRIDIPPEIWGGEEWYRALRHDQVRFAYALSMVAGRPVVNRDALEAAFNPDRDSEAETQSEPEPPEEIEAAVSPEASPAQPTKKRRSHDAIDDARLRNRINNVITLARNKWPDQKKRPGPRIMAKELQRTHGKSLEFKSETVRKILDGTYPPSKRLGISGI
jgi:hypothetical protein